MIVRTRFTLLSLSLVLLAACNQVAPPALEPQAVIAVACEEAALIDAINQANSTTEADTLNLANGCTYTLTAQDNFRDGENGLPAITTALTVQGNGAIIERDSAAPGFRLFYVAVGGNLTLDTLTVRNGFAGDGGGLRNQGGTLTLTNVTLSGNTASSNGGGGIYNGNGSTLTVTNSTFSGNSANRGGGGILNFSSAATLTNTIVANSPSGGNCSNIRLITDLGGNLSSDDSCGFSQTTSQNGVDPLLDPDGLGDNDGPTQTIALQEGSPAIDAGVNCPPPDTDQRGVQRPQGRACDSGAFEVEQAAVFPSTPVLDDFNRRDGALGSNWQGFTSTRYYRIKNKTLDVQDGGLIVWRNSFAPNQEAYVTFTQLDPQGRSLGLLLKAQDSSRAEAGCILVAYDAQAKRLRVSAIRVGARRWTFYTDQAVTLTNGEVLGAQVLADGQVRVYQNGVLLTTVTLNAADQSFFNPKGGKIGIWALGAADARLDDFGGGTLAP